MDDRKRFQGELVYIEDFLHALKNLGTDSKLDKLTKDLNSIFMLRDKVILFTQYADTMDYLGISCSPSMAGRLRATLAGVVNGGMVAWESAPEGGSGGVFTPRRREDSALY